MEPSLLARTSGLPREMVARAQILATRWARGQCLRRPQPCLYVRGDGELHGLNEPPGIAQQLNLRHIIFRVAFENLARAFDVNFAHQKAIAWGEGCALL